MERTERIVETDMEAFVDRAAIVIGVPLDPALRQAVAANFAHFSALFEQIEGFDPPDAPDPPAVFRP